ncbi:uncharacterized protein LOC105798637 [Gossypium raimondii]|uniref:uncharacterized protein LOC105798637 n=1 Tax=Gossypium raimondii TaxID=29730 RepID=UPI00227B618A|nr:uncharacterized protein LOC105798637 [Gossypium raimondii]XP_052477366.1 uncharacterized protein LOC105798637 [Gossypium raimondii]
MIAAVKGFLVPRGSRPAFVSIKPLTLVTKLSHTGNKLNKMLLKLLFKPSNKLVQSRIKIINNSPFLLFTRMNHASPTYTTIQQDKFHPVYVSSLVFDGKTYRGEVAGSKKEAEQLVARIAIESLLGFDSGILLQIINSKSKAHNGRNTINGHSGNMINTQRPVLVGPSKQPVNV